MHDLIAPFLPKQPHMTSDMPRVKWAKEKKRVTGKEALEKIRERLEEQKNAPLVSSPVVVPEKIDLTMHQKKVVIGYFLSGFSKGLFEDVPEFWAGLSQEEIDVKYASYQEAVEDFIGATRNFLFKEMDKRWPNSV